MSGISVPTRARSVVALAWLAFATGLPAQTAPGSTDPTGAGEKVSIEVFKGPHVKEINTDFGSCLHKVGQDSPCGEDRDSSGGAWTYLAFMIDPQGKPFEIAVTRSSGSKAFDKSATGIVEHARFEPATLNGKPIESSFELKVVKDTGAGARPEYVSAYKALTADIEWGDKGGRTGGAEETRRAQPV